MEANQMLKAMADSIRHTGMSSYETAQWSLERYRRFRATLERTRQARAAHATHPGSNGHHPHDLTAL
jgi:hypothetical protein